MSSIHRNKLSKFMNTRSGKLTKIKRRAKNTYLPIKKSTKRTAQSKSKSKSKKVRRRQPKNTQNTPKKKYSLRKMISNLFK